MEQKYVVLKTPYGKKWFALTDEGYLSLQFSSLNDMKKNMVKGIKFKKMKSFRNPFTKEGHYVDNKKTYMEGKYQ